MAQPPPAPARERSVSRDRAVDVLKGLATILVVFGHVNRGVIERIGGTPIGRALTTLDFIIYTTHMPVFFLIAGYFTYGSLRRRSASGYAKTRFRDIAYPYLIWSILFVAAHRLFAAITPINHPLGTGDLWRIGWQPINVLWFLYALLILQLAALLLRRTPWWVLLPIAAVVTMIYLQPAIVIPGVLGQTLAMAPFFLFGMLAAAIGWPLIARRLARTEVLVLVGLAFLLGCWFSLRTGIDVPVGSATLPLSALGIALISGVSQRIARSGAAEALAQHLAWIGGASLSIYLLHVLTLALVPRMFARVGEPPVIFALIAGTLVGVYGSLLLAWLIERVGLSGALGLRSGSPMPPRRASETGPA